VALITAAQARLLIPNLGGVGSDVDLDTLITRAGAAIAGHLGYPRRSATADASVESATYTLYSGYADGVDVSEDGGSLYLPVRPITSITSIHDDVNLDYGAAYLLDSGDYSYEANTGRIYLRPDATHGQFSTAYASVKVVVVAGYAAGSIPTDLQHACALIIQHWWQHKRAGTPESISSNGTSMQLQQRSMPLEAVELLSPYRLVRHLVA
jgi:uncharacterized phiE125 gp8 family phage protein